MVSFAGYSLPVFYENLPKGNPGGIMAEHNHTRSSDCSSIFDVSHMGQIKWHGKDRVKFLESMVCSDLASLKPGEGLLSLITNEEGGIIDDTVINNSTDGDHIYMVVNGACKFGDMEHFQKYLDEFDGDCTMEYLEDTMSLLALQGKGAGAVLSELMGGADLSKMTFMTGHLSEVTIGGVEGCKLTRCGYTGEDGFEISIPSAHAPAMAEAILSKEGVNLAGLGARDSLRLEAGLCLYGNDIDGTTSPIEGALGWTLGKPGSRRRVEQGFTGASHFLTEEGKFKKVGRKRVGLSGMKAPAREHTEIFDER